MRGSDGLREAFIEGRRWGGRGWVRDAIDEAMRKSVRIKGRLFRAKETELTIEHLQKRLATIEQLLDGMVRCTDCGSLFDKSTPSGFLLGMEVFYHGQKGARHRCPSCRKLKDQQEARAKWAEDHAEEVDKKVAAEEAERDARIEADDERDKKARNRCPCLEEDGE